MRGLGIGRRPHGQFARQALRDHGLFRDAITNVGTRISMQHERAYADFRSRPSGEDRDRRDFSTSTVPGRLQRQRNAAAQLDQITNCSIRRLATAISSPGARSINHRRNGRPHPERRRRARGLQAGALRTQSGRPWSGRSRPAGDSGGCRLPGVDLRGCAGLRVRTQTLGRDVLADRRNGRGADRIAGRDHGQSRQPIPTRATPSPFRSRCRTARATSSR